jgi:hypothetical protein
MKKIKMTKWEDSVVDLLLRRGKPLTSSQIIAEVYRGKKHPMNAREIVNGKLERMIRKLEWGQSDVVVTKSKRRGPHPISYEARQQEERSTR